MGKKLTTEQMLQRLTKNVKAVEGEKGIGKIQTVAKRTNTSNDSPTASTPSKVGTRRITVAFAFQEADVDILESTQLWCLTNKCKANSSQIVRAALSLIPRDHTLLDAIAMIKETDGRRNK